MIQKIKITNFKSIENLNIKFNKLNLLCGENASGKTTVIHSLLIAAQRKQNNRNFDGEIVKIGDLSELKNFYKGSEILIEVKIGRNKKQLLLKRNENLQDENKDVLLVKPIDNDFFSFDEQVFYLSSNRVGVKDTYTKGDNCFGINGETAISFLSEHQDNEMPDCYMEKFKAKFKTATVANNKKLIEHVRFWLERITSEKININTIPYTNQYVLTFGGENNIRPINTGSGFSYVLPIVITCLGSVMLNNDSLVIIENPEIYLHPEAQFKLSEFFIFVSTFSQLIIETHSEHILKTIMGRRRKDHQVLVFEKKNRRTEVQKLDGNSFKTNPVAYPEVLYKAFNLVSVELHTILFSLFHANYNASQGRQTSILEFDQWLCNTYVNVPKKLRARANGTTYNTLLTYIRNTIDHPEEKDATGKIFKYNIKELKQSIDFMLSVL